METDADYGVTVAQTKKFCCALAVAPSMGGQKTSGARSSAPSFWHMGEQDPNKGD
jgi:hypothetical protein